MVLKSEAFATLVGPIDSGSQIVVERPKVVFCAATRTFVMWCHLDVSENTAVDAWANYVYRRAVRALGGGLGGTRGGRARLRISKP